MIMMIRSDLQSPIDQSSAKSEVKDVSGEKIMIIDDEQEISELIRLYMEREGFTTSMCSRGDVAVAEVAREKPDLIILDVLLPGLDGLEACQEIRKITNAPIIFVSCKNDDMDKILGLRVGGDDYLAKPFHPGELVARVKAQLRRDRINHQQSPTSKLLECGPLQVNLDNHEVCVDGKVVSLSVKEFEILTILAQSPHRVFTHDQIMRLAWEEEPLECDNRTVMVHISNLRKKIENNPQNPRYILTVRGVGYKFGRSDSQ